MKRIVCFGLTLFAIIMTTQESIAQKMSKELSKYIGKVVAELDQISPNRQKVLKEIGDYVYEELKNNKKANLLAICTHNSRRSQIAQIWIETAAIYYGIQNVNAFSGGTEATAFHPNAIAAIKRAGFFVSKEKASNPRIKISAGNNLESWLMYSKKFTDKINPQKNFAGIMVCSDADKSCPIVAGADKRFSLPFSDPRYFDNTPSQNTKYDETVQKIAQEMFFMIKQVKGRIIQEKEGKK